MASFVGRFRSYPDLPGMEPQARARTFVRRVWPVLLELATASEPFRLGLPSLASLNRADAMCSHLANETGFGAALWNFNFGNVHGTGPAGSFLLTDTNATTHVRELTPFRSYFNVRQGLADYVAIIRRSALRWDTAGFQPEAFGGILQRTKYLTGEVVIGHVPSEEELNARLAGPLRIARSESVRPSTGRAAVAVGLAGAVLAAAAYVSSTKGKGLR